MNQVYHESKGTSGFTTLVFTFTTYAPKAGITFMCTMYHMISEDMSFICGPMVDNVEVITT